MKQPGNSTPSDRTIGTSSLGYYLCHKKPDRLSVVTFMFDELIFQSAGGDMYVHDLLYVYAVPVRDS